MPNTDGYNKPTSLREVDFASYFYHYRDLLWRWKWWIAVVAPLTAGIAAVLMLPVIRGTHKPVLPATVLIGVEPLAGKVTISNEREDQSESESPDSMALTQLIKSRTFLRSVVDSLSLRLTVVSYDRSEIFNSVMVESLMPSGTYRFKIDKNNRSCYSISNKDSILARGPFDKLDSLQAPGIHLRFTSSFLKKPYDFKFSISDFRNTVENLLNSVSVQASSPSYYESHPSFAISVKGKDYALAAITANVIAIKFVARSLGLRKARAKSAQEIFSSELDKAKSEMEVAEKNLRDFRTLNPTVGLSQSTEDMLLNSSAIENLNDSVAAAVNDAQLLQDKLSRAAQEDLPGVNSEILVFLKAQRDNAAPYLAEELSRLIEDKHRMGNTYDKDHPLMLKNKAETRQVFDKVKADLMNFIDVQKQRQTKLQSQILSTSQKIHTLPAEELKLAELSQLKQVKADIYAKVLDKFSQETVSEDTEIPDIYIMEYASAPIAPPPMLLNPFALCFFLFLLLVFGPMIAADLTAKTVWTESELRKSLDVRVMETIPRIVFKRRTGSGEVSNEMSANLIVNHAQFKDEYISELFQLLRAKIYQMLLNGSTDKTIVITSLESNVGKSTIAANIAVAMAQQNLRTVLIDGDLRLGTLHRLFNVSKSPGLAEFLSSDRIDGITPSIHLHHLEVIPSLTIISCGESQKSESELIASSRLQSLIQMLAKDYDVVILDSPPIGIVADALSINQFFSHYLMVLRAGQTNVSDFRDLIAEHPMLRSKLLGIVLNFAAQDRKKGYYYKHSKYYIKSAKSSA